jgi:hypothetical protein
MRGYDMTKRFPEDYTHAELNKLVLYHHSKHTEYKTKYLDTRDQLIEIRKELSALKRKK